MEVNRLEADMLFCVTCKFEMAIFKIVQAMTENIRFVFLYVLSIHTFQFTYRILICKILSENMCIRTYK